MKNINKGILGGGMVAVLAGMMVSAGAGIAEAHVTQEFEDFLKSKTTYSRVNDEKKEEQIDKIIETYKQGIITKEQMVQQINNIPELSIDEYAKGYLSGEEFMQYEIYKQKSSNYTAALLHATGLIVVGMGVTLAGGLKIMDDQAMPNSNELT